MVLLLFDELRALVPTTELARLVVCVHQQCCGILEGLWSRGLVKIEMGEGESLLAEVECMVVNSSM